MQDSQDRMMAENDVLVDTINECRSDAHEIESSAKDFSSLTDIYWVCFHLLFFLFYHFVQFSELCLVPLRKRSDIVFSLAACHFMVVLIAC